VPPASRRRRSLRPCRGPLPRAKGRRQSCCGPRDQRSVGRLRPLQSSVWLGGLASCQRKSAAATKLLAIAASAEPRITRACFSRSAWAWRAIASCRAAGMRHLGSPPSTRIGPTERSSHRSRSSVAHRPACDRTAVSQAPTSRSFREVRSVRPDPWPGGNR
jgi:hypothetical protein